MDNSTVAKNARAFPPELVAKLGLIPDSVMADLVKALPLHGLNFAMLKPAELEVFDFFRQQGRKYGVAASVVSDADPAELENATSQQHQDEIMRRANSSVSVVLS
ncbi:hypothetical protein P5706_36505 [Pseudomonas sp. ChxA]|jgi:hypothetical protein|uniref:hypothetical protein n=1 Tax=Pseudomonas TaxID=286 RepID=UPI000997DE60|nr:MULTISPECIES: hypothetical protein [Pseudomonas]MBJ2202653.1 hypothetical protein [Pseudomonas carnis]MBX9405632.1 hypothetical protein [Pseudomonas baetica]MDL2189678.1 hypothetical protein [Pseudomonas sp. ChxA]